MRMFNPDAGEIMRIERLERKGSVLVVHGQIMEYMPLIAELRPEEMRAALKLLNFRTILFLITLPFRRSTVKERAAP